MSIYPEIEGFYVSDVTGEQSPYSEAIFRAERQRVLEDRARRLEALNSGEEQAGQEISSDSVSSNSGSIDSSHVRRGRETDEVGAGMAGASALYRGRGSDASHSQVRGAKGIPSESERKEYQSKTVPRVVPSAEIEGKSPKSFLVRGQEAKESHRVNPYAKLDEAQPKRKRAILASQIMSTEVFTLAPNDSVTKARKVFRDHRFRHIPVVSKKGEVVGILADRDLLVLDKHEVEVGQVMTDHVLTARPDTEIRHVARVMFQERIGALPIVDEEGLLAGILTRTDILRTVVNDAPLELWV